MISRIFVRLGTSRRRVRCRRIGPHGRPRRGHDPTIQFSCWRVRLCGFPVHCRRAEPAASRTAGPASSTRTAQRIPASTGGDRSARYEECPKRRHAERSAVETAGNAASTIGGSWNQRPFAVQRTGRDAGDTAAREPRRQSGRGAKIAPDAADLAALIAVFGQSRRKASHTCATWASVSSGYIGKLNTSHAATSVARHPEGPKATRFR